MSRERRATAKLTGRHCKRRRRVQFLDFPNKAVADYPDRRVHVPLTNLPMHKQKRDLWLARQPGVRFHCAPTHTSRTNRIEIWFSLLSGKSLSGPSLQVVDQLEGHIAIYNANTRPFAWTKS